MKTSTFLIFLLVFLGSCSKKEAEQQANKPVSSPKIIPIINLVEVREKPGLEGKTIAQLSKGMDCLYLQEISDFTTYVKLQGVQYDEPWLKVRLQNGKTGWVYGGAVRFEASEAELNNLLINKRLQSFFGKHLSNKIQAHRKEFLAISSAEEFASVYEKAKHLRDELVEVLEKKISIDDQADLPDMFWIEESMLGFVAQTVAEGTQYYLFMDYQQWADRAAQTQANIDDEFISLCYQVFPLDSVEYFYKSWFQQTWDYGGSSLLGKGVHSSLLKAMETLQTQSPLFEPQIKEWKNELVEDITNSETTYWQSQEDILKELNALLAKPSKLLSNEEKILLEQRKKAFQNPSTNKITVNLRAGQE